VITVIRAPRASPEGCDLSRCGAPVERDGLCATCAAALDALRAERDRLSLDRDRAATTRGATLPLLR
jgi:hypothetical protein